MTDNSSFLKFALPNSNDDKDSYTQWTLSPVVTAIKVAIDKLGMKDQELQRQLLSLLSSYPKAWIMDFFDVGRALATKARDHSAAFGPGQRPLTSSKIKRERRVGPIEDFFQEWIRRPENTEASPEIKRSGSGNLMTGQICYRILCRNKGYEKYCIDAKKEGCPSYGKTHFYLRNDEMGLVDTKSEGGLCPNCTKYGKETWDWLLRCTEFVYSQTDTRRRSAREAVAKYSNYFVRGGTFYHSLDQSNDCLDWCCMFALSDPFDKDFQGHCDHTHLRRDATVVECDNFLISLKRDSQMLVGSKIFGVKYVRIDGDVEEEGTVQYLRYGKLRIKPASGGAEVDIAWNMAGLSNDQLNLLALTDFIDGCITSHKRYRRHLYLDRTQSFGEIQLGRTLDDFGKIDYMMKLRAKQWQADTSKFHLLMNKGTSVHVLSCKSRVNAARCQKMLDEDPTSKVEIGDYNMTWIDSFGSNTAQGGYETFCAQCAGLQKWKELDPNVETIGLASDAGSGYKSSQTILGLRDSKILTGVRVSRLHFNASGEGKRWETDGHNTAVKVHRESAMRAGQPPRCATPAQEVQAQQFQNGIPGTYPGVLEFGYEFEMAVDTWKGISAFHDFELHENGDVTAWKAYGVGKGKRFLKAKLDKYYPSFIPPNDPAVANETTIDVTPLKFPQGATGARFVSNVLAAEHTAKIEPSSRKKRKNAVDRMEKADARKQQKLVSDQDARDALDAVIAKRAPYQCSLCEQRFRRMDHFEDHACQVELSQQQQDDQRGSSQQAPATERLANVAIPFQQPETIVSDPLSEPFMGHGLTLYRLQGFLDSVVRSILEEQFGKGEAKTSSRKGVLEMLEQCERTVPELICPSIDDISGWLASRLTKKKTPTTGSEETPPRLSADTATTSSIRIPKTLQQKRQEDAAVLTKAQSKAKSDPLEKELFRAKYMGILVVHDDVIRIVAAVHFVQENSKWTLQLHRAKVDKYDDRTFLLDTEATDMVSVDIIAGRNGPGRFIKQFNRSVFN
jgi:hypothetical protein